MIKTKGFFTMALLLSALLLASGCATIFAPGYDDITIESNPPGAEVYVGTEVIGTTPFTKRFDRKTFAHVQITLRKEDYKPETVPLQRTLETTSLFNFGFISTTAGGTSWGIDALSGNMIRYQPNSYLIDLQKSGDEESAIWQMRHHALRFVLSNKISLAADISRNGGEYLEAYYRLFAPVSTATYPAFLRAVSDESAALLDCANGLELSWALEGLIAPQELAMTPSAN